MFRIIVYLNQSDNTYYYKLIKHRSYNYYVGYVNQYNHKVILIIDNILENYYVYRPPLKKRIIKKLINFLEKKL